MRLGFKIANEGEPPSQTMTVTLSGGAIATGTFTTTCGAGQYFWKCWEQENLAFTATTGGLGNSYLQRNQPAI